MRLHAPKPKLYMPPRGLLAARKLTELPDVPPMLYAHGGGAMPHATPSGVKQAAAGGGGGSFGVTFTGADKDSTGSTSIAGLPFGAADSNRYMLAVGYARLAGTLVLSGCTIGGGATTSVWNTRRSGSTDQITFAFVTTAALTSGTSGTVALTFSSGTPSNIAICMYRMVTTGAAPTVLGTGVASGGGVTSTGNLTRDTTGTTPFVVYAVMFAQDTAVLTVGGSALTSPTTDYETTWGASTSSFKTVSDDTPGVNASATFNASSTVSTVYVHGCCVITP